MRKAKMPRILVADNDEDVLVRLERVLENSGYATTTAISYEEAARHLAQDSFHLCVLDDYLSDKDSIEVLTEMRQAGSAPLVIVTYHRFPSPREERQLRNLGVAALVNKMAHEQLAKIVSELLEPIDTPPRGTFSDMT